VEFGARRERSSAAVVEPVPVPEPARAPRREMRGNTAVVTGAATGLGRSIALEFARRGVNIAFNYIELPGRDVAAQALLTETAIRAAGVEVYSEHCDVRDGGAVAGFVRRAVGELGGVHYLINNAGISHDAALWRMADDAWREVLETNVTGCFNCIHAVAPYLREQRYGKIVSVSSHQAYRPGFGVANYAASKAAVIGLTKAAAVELGPYNINVNAVAPGFVRTELIGALPAAVLEDAEKVSVLGRIAEPEDVANVTVFLCSDEARHITGQVILVDGGLTLH
jgi:3-oxoacyl-[acyl-carrier protein] reductase